MVEGTPFSDVHATLVRDGIPHVQAFATTVRVFRSGGLTKDAVYLRGLVELVDHLAAGGDLDDAAAREDAADRRAARRRPPPTEACCTTRCCGRGTSTTPHAGDRLARLADVRSPIELIGEAA